MLNYREEHNHRWAHNLSQALKYFKEGDLTRVYQGDINASFPFPGMKILGAFWTAENMEMNERLTLLLDVLKLKDEIEYEERSETFYRLFLNDVVEMNHQMDLFEKEDLLLLLNQAEKGTVIPENWMDIILNLETRFEEIISQEKPDIHLLREYFDYCLRHILSYAKNLIRQGVRTALFVKYNSVAALEKAVDPTIDYFSWKINRVFFNEAMPQTGFSDLGDIVSLGAYGMLADQEVSPSSELKLADHTEKRSYLNTCQLYGFIDSCATFLGLPKGCTSHAYCKYCVGHGRTTMHFVIPPEYTLDYSLEEGLGYGRNRCTFLLKTMPGSDDARCENAISKIFGDEELSYQHEGSEKK